MQQAGLQEALHLYPKKGCVRLRELRQEAS
jgi:hypothetical protein